VEGRNLEISKSQPVKESTEIELISLDDFYFINGMSSHVCCCYACSFCIGESGVSNDSDI